MSETASKSHSTQQAKARAMLRRRFGSAARSQDLIEELLPRVCIRELLDCGDPEWWLIPIQLRVTRLVKLSDAMIPVGMTCYVYCCWMRESRGVKEATPLIVNVPHALLWLRQGGLTIDEDLYETLDLLRCAYLATRQGVYSGIWCAAVERLRRLC